MDPQSLIGSTQLQDSYCAFPSVLRYHGGFDDAVGGHFDVADQLSRCILYHAVTQFSDERDTKRSIDSQGEFEARRGRVRETLRSGIGGAPDRSTDLSMPNACRSRERELERITRCMLLPSPDTSTRSRSALSDLVSLNWRPVGVSCFTCS